RIAELTRPYGTQDAEELQGLREKGDALERTLKAVEEQFSELLAGESLDSLRQQLTVIEASLHDRLNRFTHWKESPPVLSELQSGYEKSRKVIQDAAEKAGDDFDAAQMTWQNLDKAKTKLGADV